jgi:hypothetical protein
MRRFVLITRRRDKIFTALTFIGSSRADVFQRVLPRIIHTSDDDCVFLGRRDFENHRTFACVVERIEVNRVGIRSERLVSPVHRLRPVDNLVGRSTALHCGL